MHPRNRPYMLLALTTICLVLLFSGSVSAQSPVETNILEQASQEQGLAVSDLEIGSLVETNLPITGVSFYQAKILDRTTGKIYLAAVDAQGIPVDAEAARLAEKQAYRAHYGNLQPALYDLLQSKSAGDTVQVGIWLKTGTITPMQRPAVPPPPAIMQDGNNALSPSQPDQVFADQPEKTPEELKAQEEARDADITRQTEQNLAAQAPQDEAYRQALAAFSQQIGAAEAPFLQELSSAGLEPIYVSPYAPLVYVDMPKANIQALSQREDIDTIYGPNTYHDMMDSARPTQKGDVVNTWGYTGTGVNVAILEDNRIEFTNPYIPDGVTRDMGGTTDEHSAATAGMVASTHSTYRGIASGVSLFSANAPGYSEANLSAAMDWSVAQGVNVINNSWGGDDGTTNLNVHDRHLDYIVRNHWRTVTVAAGNSAAGCGGVGRVGSPARGYNVISVGNYMDNNTLTWTGDVMDTCSSYVNPSTGVEKPELAAVGSDITSTTNNPAAWIADVGSGTSYAAPMVSGEAALLMQRDTILESWPEPVKAILMASALHNIEGATRLSDLDGAGGVDMRAAFHVLDTGAWNAWQTTSSSFPLSYYVYAYAGEPVRAAIAWDSNPSADYTTDPMQADLDLHVYDPGANLLTYSVSYDNNFEIVEFTAPVSGNYELRVTRFRYDGVNEYVGIAAWTPNRVLSPYAPGVWATPPVSHDYYRVTPGAGDWHAVGIRSPSSNDYDVALYFNSAFGNPASYTWLEDSTTSSAVDFVVIDNNHAPLTSYYPETSRYSGSGGNAPVEFASSNITSTGTYGPYTMGVNNVVRVWDSWVDNGVRKYYAIRPTSGDANLGMALYASNSTTSGTWYQGRSQYVLIADANGAGAAEAMNYLPTASDYLGLVAWNNASTTSTSFYFYADTTPPTGSVSINAGAAYAHSTSVTLNLTGADTETGVYRMRFSNDNSTWSAWEPYAATKSWTMASGDGTQAVYAQFQNNAEMASSSYSDTIVLDTVLPTGSIVINSDAAYTNTTSVTLALSATDDRSGVYQMRLGNFGLSWGPWEAYATSKAWTLDPTGGDGTKSVWVQYTDHAGNVSTQYPDYITLDTTPPSGTISINGGAAYTNTTNVTLTLSATDALSGMGQMRFSNNGSTFTTWETYAASKAWTIASTDGTKTVYVQYRDAILNVSGSFTDTIVLDTTGPSGSIQINAGASYTNVLPVTLNLSSTDAGSGVAQMEFSNDGSSWSLWEAYAAAKAWTLPNGDGAKTVYVKYRDNLGNVSAMFQDTISLDTIKPTASASSPAMTANLAFTVSWTGSDALSGIASFDVEYRVGPGGAWTPWLSDTGATSAVFGPSLPVGVVREQTYYFRVRARDHAGNLGDFTGGDGDTHTFIALPVYMPFVVK